MLAVGLIEEAAKLIAPVAIVLYTRQRHLADGLLIGMASGAGFAALENMGDDLVVLLQSHGTSWWSMMCCSSAGCSARPRTWPGVNLLFVARRSSASRGVELLVLGHEVAVGAEPTQSSSGLRGSSGVRHVRPEDATNAARASLGHAGHDLRGHIAWSP
jgi:hypothetical protein